MFLNILFFQSILLIIGYFPNIICLVLLILFKYFFNLINLLNNKNYLILFLFKLPIFDENPPFHLPLYHPEVKDLGVVSFWKYLMQKIFRSLV